MESTYLENDSEDEGIEDYKLGGYHTPHIGYVYLTQRGNDQAVRGNPETGLGALLHRLAG